MQVFEYAREGLRPRAFRGAFGPGAYILAAIFF